MSLKKNDVIEIEITGLSSEGSGVGRHDGQAVFVSGTATGDTVQCVIIKAKKNYAVGKLQNILKASPDRIIPDCIRAALEKRDIIVRNPHSTRPYQHVLEPVMAYLMIAQKQ